MSPMMRTTIHEGEFGEFELCRYNQLDGKAPTSMPFEYCRRVLPVQSSQQSRGIRQYRPRYSTAHLQLVCGLKIEDDSEAGTSGPGANKAGAITDTPKGCKGGARRRSVAPTKRGATVGMSKKSEKPKVQCISFGNG